MNSDAPLKLRRQKYLAEEKIAINTRFVNVCVETGLFHLSSPFTYAVQTDTEITLGDCVEVPFAQKTTRGYVIGEAGRIPGAKFVKRKLSHQPVFTKSQLELFTAVSERYGCSLWDVLRLALPPIIRAPLSRIGKKEARNDNEAAQSVKRPTAWTLGLGVNRFEFALELSKRLKAEKLIVIVPNDRDIEPFLSAGFESISSNDSKAERLERYYAANFSSGIYVGNRNAVFLHLDSESSLIIIDDGDPAHHEIKQPTYNSRDVALLRKDGSDIHFVSAFHSAEIARLISENWIVEKKVPSKKKITIYSDPNNEHIQQRIMLGSKKGRVLLPSATKSYRLGISCQSCRTRASCKCGGFLIEKSKGTISCSLCNSLFPVWQCTECGSERLRTYLRGGGLQAEELARSVPQTPVIHVTADHLPEKIPPRAIVVSTTGVEPNCEYVFVGISEAERQLNHPHLRSEEIAILRWMNAISLLEDDSLVSISLPSDSNIVRSFVKSNWWIAMKPILDSRLQVKMPPYSRTFILSGEEADLKSAVKVIHKDQVLLNSSQRLILKTQLESSAETVKILKSMNTLLSMKKNRTVRVEADPFTLN